MGYHTARGHSSLALILHSSYSLYSDHGLVRELLTLAHLQTGSSYKILLNQKTCLLHSRLARPNTVPQYSKMLSEARTAMITLILASGIDLRTAVVFHQDEASVPAMLLLKTPTRGC